MRHRKKTVKLSRKPAHLRAMLANAVCSLLTRERIQTTLGRSGAVCAMAEKMITLAKRNSPAGKRRAQSVIRDRDAVTKLFKDLGPRYAQRTGGYTRIIKSTFRKGDGAPMAIIELVDTTVPVRVRKVKKDEEKKRSKG